MTILYMHTVFIHQKMFFNEVFQPDTPCNLHKKNTKSTASFEYQISPTQHIRSANTQQISLLLYLLVLLD